MRRDLDELSRGRYDLLVVGGGIHGLFLAYEAASRGMAVALVERADFGSGLSFNHQRTIHGGLRTLQTGDLRTTRDQIVERRTWASIAPHLLCPLPFLIGTYRSMRRSRLVVGAGFALYDLLGRSRNDRLPRPLHLPATHTVSRARAEQMFPGIATSGLTGGALWHDYQTRHPDRLNWLVALAAERAGARLANYADAMGPLTQGGRVTGAHIRDVVSGSNYAIEAAATVLAAGSRLGGVLRAFDANRTETPPLVSAANLLLDRPAAPIALVAQGRSGRMLTAVPWQGYTLVGTFQSDMPVLADDDDLPAPAAIDAMVADANSAFPALRATREDIRLVHHGLTPATVEGGRAALLPASRLLGPEDGTPQGLYAIVGVKFTTARRTAEVVAGRIARDIGFPASPSRSATTVLPHAGSPPGGLLSDRDRSTNRTRPPDHAQSAADATWSGRGGDRARPEGSEVHDAVDGATWSHLVDWYGTEAGPVAAHAAAQGLLERLSPDAPVIRGEIAYAVEHGCAIRLADAVTRRTRLGATGRPDADALACAASIMGRLRGWTDAERAREIAAVLERYGH